MNQLRLVVGLGALCALCLACPGGSRTTDAGESDGGDGGALVGGCTGGCGPNLVCDAVHHVCVDPCGGCASGVCIKNAQGQYGCQAPVTSCGAAVCAAGQTTCVSGACSCVDASRGGVDSCAPAGRICHALFNPATQQGGACDGPRRYDECRTKGCTGGACAACPAGQSCTMGLFGEEIGTCMKQCPNGSAECDVDERCDTQSKVCYPRSLFTNVDCARLYPFDGGFPADAGADAGTPDAGDFVVAATVGELCTVIAEDGAHEATPTGNCSYSVFQLSTQRVPIANCRPGGAAIENAICRRDFSSGASATRCGTGLECVLTRGDEGLCLRLCNAAVPGGCEGGEACVNLLREPNAVAALGACMKSCDVFATDGGNLCPSYGATPSTCIPTSVRDDGTGLCVPHRATVATLGQACAETDPLRGAACGAGAVCNFRSPAPLCEQPCDLACAKTPAPARCAVEPNATCPAGLSCARMSSASTATLGYCR